MLIEMHAHVLWGVDDGPRDREEMIRMLYEAAESGVERLYCTAHAMPGIRDFPLKAYQARLAEAREWCREHAPQLRLEEGTEVFYTPQTLAQLSDGQIPALGGGKTVLVEFDPNVSPKTVRDAAAALWEAGYQPVLAHAERYRRLNRFGRIRVLRQDQHLLVQVNAASVFNENAGYRIKKRIRSLLQTKQVDFVSSDAHDPASRPFCLPYAHHWLKGRLGEAEADALCGGNAAEMIR